MRHYLTVYQETGRPVAPLVATVLRLETDAPADWVKAHADELAQVSAGHLPLQAAPCALWVSSTDPMLELRNAA